MCSFLEVQERDVARKELMETSAALVETKRLMEQKEVERQEGLAEIARKHEEERRAWR